MYERSFFLRESVCVTVRLCEIVSMCMYVCVCVHVCGGERQTDVLLDVGPVSMRRCLLFERECERESATVSDCEYVCVCVCMCLCVCMCGEGRPMYCLMSALCVCVGEKVFR